jgi:DNA-binding NarL/FixJ family response regulator
MAEAAVWFSDRGFSALAGACRGLARRAGATQRRRGRGESEVPAHLYPLGVTSREVDVLRLVAEGLTNREIAARLYLSPGTVKGYVEQLLAKTGSANRIQLAARLER